MAKKQEQIEELEKQNKGRQEEIDKLNKELEKQNKGRQEEIDKLNTVRGEKEKECKEKLDEKERKIEELNRKLSELLPQEAAPATKEDCEETINKLKKIFNEQFETIKKIQEKTTDATEKEIQDTINKIKLKYEELKITIPDSYNINDCDTINKIWNKNNKMFDENKTRLANLSEDILGSVRTFIKIKPLEDNTQTATVTKDGENVTVICNNTSHSYGPFYNVFPDTFQNKDVFRGKQITGDNINDYTVKKDETDEKGLYNTLKQVESGYSIVLFGYGLSGAGKTRTLFGNNETPGLIHYGLANLENVTSITVTNIFELYGKDAKPTTHQCRADIIHLISELPEFKINPPIDEAKYKDYTKNENKAFAEFVNKTEPTPEFKINGTINIDTNKLQSTINSLTSTIEKYRIDKKRIKSTPNNPTSSRSHLFIIFKITFQNGKSGYITVIDSAGRERTDDILNQFTKDAIGGKATSVEFLMTNPRPEELIEQDITDEKYNTTILQKNGYYITEKITDNKGKTTITKRYDTGSIADIYREGIYINLTLNHLSYYLKYKSDIKRPIMKLLDYWVDPRMEFKNIIKSKNNVLIIPILNYLNNINKDNNNKPTKFITIVHVRQDNDKCTQTLDTLNFAQQIKST